MKAKELRDKSPEELQKLLTSQRAKLRQLRFDLPGGKLKNVRDIEKARREIARILTIIHEAK